MFLINDNNEIIRFSGNTSKIDVKSKIKSAFINSRDIDFNLFILPKTSLLNIVRICFHRKEKNIWSRLFLRFKDEFCKKSPIRVLQEISSNKRIIDIAENVCPIELVVAKWCLRQSDNWWIFCTKDIDNKTYRIIAGYRNCVAISRFVEIVNDDSIFAEIYKTSLYLRRYWSVDSIDLFSNLSIVCDSGLKSNYIKIRRFNELNAFQMLMRFAKKRDIFYPVFRCNKIYFSDRNVRIFNNICVCISIIFLCFSGINFKNYIDLQNKNYLMNQNIANNRNKINAYFSINDTDMIYKVLNLIENKQSVFNVLKKYSVQIFKINSMYFSVKNNSIFIEIHNKLNEDFVKSAFDGVKNQKLIFHVPESKNTSKNAMLEVKL